VVAVDPTRRRSGGALLGDRIRMNSLAAPRLHALAGDAPPARGDQRRARRRASRCRAPASTWSSSRPPASARATPRSSTLADVSLYVMTAEYGAASQLEKIDMLDFAAVHRRRLSLPPRGEEDPTRMFAGEGAPERTNRRFHYLAGGHARHAPVDRVRLDHAVRRGSRHAARHLRPHRQLRRVHRHARRHEEALLGLRSVRAVDLGVDDHQRPGADDPRDVHEHRHRSARRAYLKRRGRGWGAAEIERSDELFGAACAAALSRRAAEGHDDGLGLLGCSA
jgi:hypothetical protein